MLTSLVNSSWDRVSFVGEERSQRGGSSAATVSAVIDDRELCAPLREEICVAVVVGDDLVKSPSMVDKINLWSKIEDRARRITKPTSLSLIVHDIKDVNEQLEKGFYFFSDIKKEGIVIYDSGQLHLAEPKERPMAEPKAHAEAWFKQWFESAIHFVETHEFSVSKGRYKEAAFLLHQATERFYHCALLVLTA